MGFFLGLTLMCLIDLGLVTTVLGREKCYSCAYNDHVTQKRGIECVGSPRNASPDWAVRCEYRCYYTTTVVIETKQLLSIVRGCGVDIGPNGCDLHGTREVCRYNCDTDLCNGGLMGIMVEKDKVGSGVSVITHTVYLLIYLTLCLSVQFIMTR